MAIRVLGPLETGSEHALSPRERVVLAALIVRAGRAVTPGELAEAYWGENSPRTWPQQVKTSVARIRSGLGSSAILTRGSDYVLGIDPATIDAFEFERLVSTARQHALRGEHDRAIDAYRRALALWHGNAYIDVADWEPGVIEAERLAEIRDNANEELLEARLAEGEHRSVIADAERLVREAPLRENRWAILAMANYRSGRQADALATLRASRAKMSDELGIDVGDRLRELETAMLRQDPALSLVESMHRVSEQCPYLGLEAFSLSDADAFFGRDADIDAIRDRMRPGALVVVVGASGSGKSSLVLAGVLPRITESRRVAVVTAGRDAAVDLRSRIAQQGAADVVGIDQAEAIFQLPAAERDALCAIVADLLNGGACVIMTLRSDFLDRSTGMPHIGAEIGRGVYAIGPLSVDGLREAVERPAERAGLRLEPGLVEVIVRDAGDRRTTLPHVSHALVETWIRREGATLTVAGYQASGGIAGAIAQSAETLYRSFDDADADSCRSLMLRLVHRGADGASVRRSAVLAPLVADASRRRVLDRLVASRLLTTDGDQVTVAHEAVATAWPRLDRWLEEDAEGARLVSTVATATELWNGSGRRHEDLLRGARLQAALDWRDHSEPDLTVEESDFLDASAERERDEVRELAERAARDKRNNRRLRWAVAGAGVLLVAAIFGGGLAAVRGGEAELSAESARVEALVATSLALLENDRETAALIAAEAFRRWPQDPRVRSALWGVAMSTGGLLETHREEGALSPGFATIPNTSTALRVTYREDDAIRPSVDVVDVETAEVIRSYDLDLPAPSPDWNSSVVVSRDGSTAAIQTPVPLPGSDRGPCCWNHVAFLDLTTGGLLPGTGLVRAQMSGNLALDATGDTLYAVHPVTADVLAIDTKTGAVRASSDAALDEHPLPIFGFQGLALIDERVIAVGAGDHLRLFDRETLTLGRTIPLEGDVTSLDIVADGEGGIVTTGLDGTVRVMLATGEVLWRRFPNPTRNCATLHLATDAAVACGSYEGVALVDLATGETKGARATLGAGQLPLFETIDAGSLLVSVPAHSVWMRWRIDGGAAGADVIAKGRELVTGPEKGGSLAVTQPVGGGRMQLWDLELDAPVGEEADRIVPLGSGVIARYDALGVPRLEQLSTGDKISLRVPGMPETFDVLPGAWDSPAFAWWTEGIVAFEPTTGEPLGPVMTAADNEFTEVASASETPDAALAVISWYDGTRDADETGVFDLRTGENLARGLYGIDHTRALEGGQFIGVAAENARRYDIRTLEPVSTLARALGGGMLTSASADGRTLLNVGFNNALTLYDLTADIALGPPLYSPAATLRLIDMFTLDERVPGGFLTADGETLLEAMPDGIRVWDLRPAEQAMDACALAGREMTPEEWATYFPGEEQVHTCAALESRSHAE